MAVSVPLLDFEQDESISQDGGKSSARQRRRRTVRRLDSKTSNGNDGDSFGLSSISPVKHVIANPGAPALPLESNADSVEKKGSEIGRSARARRSRSRRQNISEKTLPSPLPPLQGGLISPMHPHGAPLPPLRKGQGSPLHLPFTPQLPPLHTSLEDSATGVANLLRRKLELDQSQGEESVATTGRDLDRKHRKKIRSSARTRRKTRAHDREHQVDGSDDQKDSSSVTQLVNSSTLQDGPSHGDGVSGHSLKDLPGLQQDDPPGGPSEAGNGATTAGDDSTESRPVGEDRNNQEPVHSMGRPLPVINSPTLEGMPENGAKSDSLLQPPGSDAVMAPPVPEELYRTCTDVLGITVHGTDELKASIYLAHPSVKVSIMDVSNSGNLLKKSAPDKCVTSYYEGGNPSVDYILPVLTQPYDCIEHRRVKGILKSNWEEMVIFNDLLVHFTENPNVIIFFELVDFVRGYRGGSRNKNKPWHQIAWAFLRPTGRVCKSMFAQKIRLQFYKYKRKRFHRTTESAEVYALWTTSHRTSYPSTLHVTLQAIPIASLPEFGQDEMAGPIKRSMFPLQEERGTLTLEEMAAQKESFLSLASAPTDKWASRSSRLPGHPCKVPTSVVTSLAPTRNGCSCLAFSNSGYLLAAGCVDQNDICPLILFKVPSFEPALVLEGHRGIIYSLCWEPSDSLLVSASADSIVKVWSMSKPSMEPWASLPHPCYVYCACFVPNPLKDQSPVVATGAYDGCVRMWEIAEGTAQIIAEFQGNSSRINCMCWSSKRLSLYIGDSSGILSVWRKTNGAWKQRKTCDLINSQALSSIYLHPNGRNILMHSFKQTLSIIDLRIDAVSYNFVGRVSSGLERCSSLVSPCGGLVFAGASNGTVHVWNSSTGEQLYVYEDLPFTSAVGTMAYHPSEHLLVVSAFGNFQPILALNHESSSDLVKPVTSMEGSKTGTLLDTTTNIADGTEIRNCDSDLAFTQSQLGVSQKWNDLTRTLVRISNKIK